MVIYTHIKMFFITILFSIITGCTAVTGRAILNGDDPRCRDLALTCPCPVEFFGIEQEAVTSAAKISAGEEGLTFELNLDAKRQTIRIVS